MNNRNRYEQGSISKSGEEAEEGKEESYVLSEE